MMFSKLTTGVKTWQIYCTTQTANSKISKLVGKKMKVISKARKIEQSHCSSYLPGDGDDTLDLT